MQFVYWIVQNDIKVGQRDFPNDCVKQAFSDDIERLKATVTFTIDTPREGKVAPMETETELGNMRTQQFPSIVDFPDKYDTVDE